MEDSYGSIGAHAISSMNYFLIRYINGNSMPIYARDEIGSFLDKVFYSVEDPQGKKIFLESFETEMAEGAYNNIESKYKDYTLRPYLIEMLLGLNVDDKFIVNTLYSIMAKVIQADLDAARIG